MRRVRILPGALVCDPQGVALLPPGTEVEVPDDVAAAWVEAGRAEYVGAGDSAGPAETPATVPPEVKPARPKEQKG